MEQRRRNTSAIAPGVSFSVPGAASSLPDPKTREDGSPYAGCWLRLALDSLSSRTSGDLTEGGDPNNAFASNDCGELKGGDSALVGNMHALQKAAVGYP